MPLCMSPENQGMLRILLFGTGHTKQVASFIHLYELRLAMELLNLYTIGFLPSKLLALPEKKTFRSPLWYNYSIVYYLNIWNSNYTIVWLYYKRSIVKKDICLLHISIVLLQTISITIWHWYMLNKFNGCAIPSLIHFNVKT